MPEVSCRAFSYFRLAEADGVLDLSECLSGVSVTREFLENPRNRVSWDVWVSLMARAALQFESREAIIASGRFVVERDFAGKRFSRLLTDSVASSSELYHGAWRFVVPNNFRCIQTDFEKMSDGRLRLRASLKPGYRDGESWFVTALGALPKLPGLLGQRDAIVLESKTTPRSIDIVVQPPVSMTVFSKLRRFAERVFSPGALMEELDFQQQQLSQSYAAMRASERDFRRAFDKLPTLVVFHREGIVLYANPMMCKKLGYMPGDLIGVSLDELGFDEDHGQLVSLDSQEHEDPVSLRLRHKNGSEISVEVSAESGLTHEGSECTAIYAKDVSARNRAQQTVQALIQSSLELIVRTNISGDLLDIQGGIGFDLSPGNPDGSNTVTSFLVRIPGVSVELAGIAWRAMEDALKQGCRKSHVIEAQGSRYYDCHVSPYALGAALITIRDITELRLRERQLATADRLISLGTLVAGVGHEINNPLAYVLANAQILQEEFEGEDDVSFARAELAEISGEIVEGAERVTKIVESLRLFSRVTQAEVEEVDVEEVLARALRLSSSQFPPGVVVEQELNSPPFVLADSAKLEQVFVNLFINAAQACQESSQKPTISVKTISRDGETKVSIADNGIGVAPDDLRRVFDAFYTTKKIGEGIGLGLSISHRIIESFGGSISVTSELGQGACFTVAIPT